MGAVKRLTILIGFLLLVASCGDDEAGVTTGPEATRAPTTSAPTTTAPATTTTSPATSTTISPTTTALVTTQAVVTCSTEGMTVGLPDEPGLPVPVDAMRRAIAGAIVECDFDGLAALAQEGGFSWPDDLVGFFMDREWAAFPFMLEAFSLPYGVKAIDGMPHYVWPSPAAFSDFASLPAADRQVLVDLYGEGVLEEAEEYFWDQGYYQASWLAIDETGNWRSFWLAGN